MDYLLTYKLLAMFMMLIVENPYMEGQECFTMDNIVAFQDMSRATTIDTPTASVFYKNYAPVRDCLNETYKTKLLREPNLDGTRILYPTTYSLQIQHNLTIERIQSLRDFYNGNAR